MAFQPPRFPKPPVMKPISPPEVTARDPRTGMKATGITRFGATQKLEMKVGRKVDNPFITRK